MNELAPNPRAAEAAAALEQGVRAANAYGRGDLADRLAETRRVLLEPTVNVVVVGEFKQGKSSFINALLNAQVCPVDDDIATAVPTSVRFGDDRAAWALTRTAEPQVNPVFADGSPDEPDELPPADRRPIDFDEIEDFATERPVDRATLVEGVEVQLPRRLLADGLVLVDTPGVGGLGSAHATAALGALSVADAAIFLSDASQEYTRAEMDFLTQALDMCPHVVCVMTKTDFYPAWRRVKEINEGHLGRAGNQPRILPISSTLRTEALRRDDKQLNIESGFLEIVKVLTDEIVGGAAERELTRARQDLIAVADQLASQFESELSALRDPEARAELTRRLEDAKLRSEQLRGNAAKWSTTLNDGVTDLTSDVDHDFRQRVRNVLSEADEALDSSDPMETWAEFEPWLSNRMSFEVVGNYRFLTERSTELSHRVAEHFEFAGGDVLEQLDIQNPAGALGRVTTDTGLDLDDGSAGAKGMTVLRGSYSGVLMFTMLGSMIGIALGPIAIGIGLAMGRKSLRDEKERQRTQRRSQAKNLVRRFSDDVSFQVNKDSRDTLRRTQRQIRDFYSTRAEELHRSTSEALSAANQAAQIDERERAGRIRDVKAELDRLATLRSRAVALPNGAQSGGGRR
jgi:signal recognition particle receptor subunit beta